MREIRWRSFDLHPCGNSRQMGQTRCRGIFIERQAFDGTQGRGDAFRELRREGSLEIEH